MLNLTGVVAIIHAKGSSERVQGKNRQLLGDWPLFVHAIRLAQRATMVRHVVIDSDDEGILQEGEALGAVPLKRPAELATNKTAGDGLETWAAFNLPSTEMLVVPMATSPFVKPESIDGAIGLLKGMAERNSVAGVAKKKLFLWEENPEYYYSRPAYGDKRTTQKMPWTIWETTGLYVVRTSYVLERFQRIDYENCLPYELSQIEAIDIDTPEDLELARALWRGLNQA